MTLLETIDAVHEQYPGDTLTVVLPEAVESSLRRVFTSPKILGLKAALLFRPGVAVLNVPQHLRSRASQHRPSRPSG